MGAVVPVIYILEKYNINYDDNNNYKFVKKIGYRHLLVGCELQQSIWFPHWTIRNIVLFLTILQSQIGSNCLLEK